MSRDPEVVALAVALKQADDTQGLNGYPEWADRIAEHLHAAGYRVVAAESEPVREALTDYMMSPHAYPLRDGHKDGFCPRCAEMYVAAMKVLGPEDIVAFDARRAAPIEEERQHDPK